MGSQIAVNYIKDLKPGMNGLSLSFIALDIGKVSVTKDNNEVSGYVSHSRILDLRMTIMPKKIVGFADFLPITMNLWIRD